MINTFNNYLKNLIGWKTNRKIIVFSVDDYGSIRLFSRRARENLDKAGIKVLNRFDAFDTLETRDDLSALYEALSSVKDKNDNPAVFTAFSLPININFEMMAENNYQDYFSEPLSETFKKLSQLDRKTYDGTWQLWKEGIIRNLIHPDFHGREHFNLKIFKEKLALKNRELLIALRNRSLTSISGTGYSTIPFHAAFSFWDFNENEKFKSIIFSGLNEFEKTFGFRSVHFSYPGSPEHSVLHKTLHDNEVKYINAPVIKYEHQGRGKYKKKFHYTGKRNELSQIFLVRNCIFEPTYKMKFDWVNYTFKQIETAFRFSHPAIISSHRVNYCGHIDSKNRKCGLTALKELLRKIVERYSNVEFMTGTQLGNIISKTQ